MEVRCMEPRTLGPCLGWNLVLQLGCRMLELGSSGRASLESLCPVQFTDKPRTSAATRRYLLSSVAAGVPAHLDQIRSLA